MNYDEPEDGTTWAERWRGMVKEEDLKGDPAFRSSVEEVPQMILFDTDILIDIALDRQPHSELATDLLRRIERGSEGASIAWHSVSNLYYIVSRALGDSAARDSIEELIRTVSVAATKTEDVHFAMGLPMSDFEDALQVAAARACEARFIVTRNLRDYANSPVPALHPRDALAELP